MDWKEENKRKEEGFATLNYVGNQLINRDDLEPLFNKLDKLFKDNLKDNHITPALMRYLLSEYESYIEDKALTL